MAMNNLGRVAMIHRGDYDPGYDYKPLDCCYHQGSTYFCKANTVGNAPPNAAYWVLMSTSASTADRDAAEAAALEAQGYKDQAAAQVGLAADQVALAAGHVDAAAGHVTAAQGKVDLAEAQVALAEGHAVDAGTSAVAALASEQAAAGSASAAEESAGEAEVSATAAQASANDAAASAASVDGAALMAAVEGKAEATHAHGAITTDGRVGTTPDLPLFTGPNGIVVARTMAEAAQAYQYTNPNILHNCDFRNPVNQRGVSGAISTGTYFYDRWIRNSGTVTTDEAYLAIGADAEIEQRIEGNLLAGETVTVSVMVGGTVYSGTGIMPTSAGTVSVTVTGWGTATLGYAAGYMYVRLSPTAASNVARVKLEMGTVSTLAYDAPTDYDYQLFLCQSKCINLGSYPMFPCNVISTTLFTMDVNLRVAFNGIPTFSSTEVTARIGGQTVVATANVIEQVGTRMRLSCTKVSGGNLVVGNSGAAYFEASPLIISKDL